MTVAEWLVRFEVAQNLEQAEQLCYCGSVTLNASTHTDASYVPNPGTVLRTVASDYSFSIPDSE